MTWVQRLSPDHNTHIVTHMHTSMHTHAKRSNMINFEIKTRHYEISVTGQISSSVKSCLLTAAVCKRACGSTLTGKWDSSSLIKWAHAPAHKECVAMEDRKRNKATHSQTRVQPRSNWNCKRTDKDWKEIWLGSSERISQKEEVRWGESDEAKISVNYKTPNRNIKNEISSMGEVYSTGHRRKLTQKKLPRKRL